MQPYFLRSSRTLTMYGLWYTGEPCVREVEMNRAWLRVYVRTCARIPVRYMMRAGMRENAGKREGALGELRGS